MTPLAGPLDPVFDFAGQNPIFVGLVAVMLLFIFFMYLFVRRTLLGLREGYEQGRRGG